MGNIYTDFDNPVLVMKSIYPNTQKSKKVLICDRLQQKCEMMNFPYKRILKDEICIDKKHLEYVVSLSKLAYFFYGKTIMEILKKNNITYDCYRYRIRQGWSFEGALTIMQTHRRNKGKNHDGE